VQRDLYDGKFKQAIERVLAAISAGNRDYQTLSLLGLVLLRSGALPGDPGFAQAQAVLEESAHTNPEYSPTQIALGRIYVLEERYREAVEHLEIGRRLEPRNPTVYSNLARAYQSLGDLAKAHEMREQFARLLAHNGASRESSGSTSP
jgi:Flp pilus assembly protein TadD